MRRENTHLIYDKLSIEIQKQNTETIQTLPACATNASLLELGPNHKIQNRLPAYFIQTIVGFIWF